MAAQSYIELDLGTIPMTGGYSDEWDAGDFTIISFQVEVTGADAADGEVQIENSHRKTVWDDYDVPYEVPVGASSHTWHVGIWAGRHARLRVDPGTNSAGTVQVWAFGKVKG